MMPHPLHVMDEARRARGRLADWAGCGPIATPGDVIWAAPGLRLHRYAGARQGAPLLILPAPIKRHYIFDLAPAHSVVRRCLEAGFDTLLAEWTEDAGDPDLEALVCGPIGGCLKRIARQFGRPVLVGHSVGGSLAAIAASWRPEDLAGLVLVNAPLHFGPEAGALGAMVAAAPEAERLTPLLGGEAIAGTAMSLLAGAAAPQRIHGWRWADLAASASNPELLLLHWRVERWALDEFPMSRRLFVDIVERLYRRDLWFRGDLPLDGLRLGPERLRAPLFAVFDPSSALVPPNAVLPGLAAAGSMVKRAIPWPAEPGAALPHVAALVGAAAQRVLWPRLLGMLAEHAG